VSSINIRKVKTTIDNLYLEKQKMEKGDKQKKKPGAGKVRTKLRVEVDVSYFNELLFFFTRLLMLFLFRMIMLLEQTTAAEHTKMTTIMILCEFFH